MHIQRIQVPCFRTLKNVDITFEKEFDPRIFPLGSLNGGGKSTLLQLIFVLLHCAVDPNRHSFLKNVLYGYEIPKDSNQRILAIIDVWDGSKCVKLTFFLCNNSYIKDLLGSSNTLLDIDDIEDSLMLSQDNRNQELDFISFISHLDELEKNILRLQGKMNRLENLDQELQILKAFKDAPMQQYVRWREILKELPKSNVKNIVLSGRTEFEKNPEKAINELEINIKETIGFLISNIKDFKKKHEDHKLIWQEINNSLKAKKIIYIYSFINSHKEEKILFCQVGDLDITEAEFFLKKLSQKIFLAAPITQVFLFLPQEYRNALFKTSQTAPSYPLEIDSAKSILSGFFTYDFLATELLIEGFKNARDQDFEEAVKTGEYGNNYKVLVNDLNTLLVDKKTNVTPDLSGITFKLDRDGDEVELFPEDLSHGEVTYSYTYPKGSVGFSATPGIPSDIS